VERWAAALDRDSAVAVLFLGDNIYPNGMRPRGSTEFPQDSAHLQAQINVVAGPAALGRGARGIFLAGNHDWGDVVSDVGILHLANQHAYLEEVRHETGVDVTLVPSPGDPGPVVMDLGARTRLLLLDTVWWLLSREEGRLDGVFAGIEAALRTDGEREVVLAGHHPLRSGGPHGGLTEFWNSLGVMYLLRRTGSLLQDLNSGPYRAMADDLRAAFGRADPPLVFAGGHEHSLQVFEAVEENDPAFSLVSGSASKLEDVGWADGMRFRAAEPGYMELLFLKDGSVDLFVHSAPAQHQHCPAAEGAGRDACMSAGADAFRTLYSSRLRGPVAQ
jgi:hypothetical protein